MSYAYDAIGRRVFRQDAQGNQHSFIYDGSNLVGEYNDTTGVWDTEYTYGNGLIDKQGTGGTEYQFYDGLGDVYQTLNASGNYVLSGEVSDDFGQHFGPAGTLGTDDLFYKWRGDYGYRWDGDGLWTGSYTEPIVEVGARYYIPSMGVFITRDKTLGESPYEYCDADPVNNADPSGWQPQVVGSPIYKTWVANGVVYSSVTVNYDDGSSTVTLTTTVPGQNPVQTTYRVPPGGSSTPPGISGTPPGAIPTTGPSNNPGWEQDLKSFVLNMGAGGAIEGLKFVIKYIRWIPPTGPIMP